MEQTLVLVKPDGVKRNLIGEVIARCEQKGYTVVKLSMVEPSRELLEAHYAEHKGKSFYEPLLEFMSSGPVVAICLQGERVIEGFRAMAGSTEPTTAAQEPSGVIWDVTGEQLWFRTWFTVRTLQPARSAN